MVQEIRRRFGLHRWSKNVVAHQFLHSQCNVHRENHKLNPRREFSP